MILNNKGLNNKIITDCTLQESITINLNGNDCCIKIGKNCIVENLSVQICGNNHQIIIGNNTNIYGGSIAFEDNNNLFQVGSNTTIYQLFSASVAESNRKIVIGDNCLFSNTVIIRTTDSHSIIDKFTNKRINFGKDIFIDNHVWIGESVHILKGTHVPHDCVIGKCSVVADKPFAPNSAIAGNPARVVKSDIYWVEERI